MRIDEYRCQQRSICVTVDILFDAARCRNGKFRQQTLAGYPASLQARVSGRPKISFQGCLHEQEMHRESTRRRIAYVEIPDTYK